MIESFVRGIVDSIQYVQGSLFDICAGSCYRKYFKYYYRNVGCDRESWPGRFLGWDSSCPARPGDENPETGPGPWPCMGAE